MEPMCKYLPKCYHMVFHIECSKSSTKNILLYTNLVYIVYFINSYLLSFMLNVKFVLFIYILFKC